MYFLDLKSDDIFQGTKAIFQLALEKKIYLIKFFRNFHFSIILKWNKMIPFQNETKLYYFKVIRIEVWIKVVAF